MSEQRPVFNDVSGGTGVIQECERICNMVAGTITSNSDLLKTFTSRVNNAIDYFILLAYKYDKNWSFDDRRFGDDDATKGLPILSTNIKIGVGDYLFDSDILMAEQVFLMDANGQWRELDVQDNKNDPPTYLRPTQSGTPTKYTLVGNSIILDYLPNYSAALGLKIICRRVAKHFTITNGSIPLGIPGPFAPYIARKASYPYVSEKGLKHAVQLRKEIGSDREGDPYYGGDELSIANFFSMRGRSVQTRMMGRTGRGRSADSNR